MGALDQELIKTQSQHLCKVATLNSSNAHFADGQAEVWATLQVLLGYLFWLGM